MLFSSMASLTLTFYSGIVLSLARFPATFSFCPTLSNDGSFSLALTRNLLGAPRHVETSGVTSTKFESTFQLSMFTGIIEEMGEVVSIETKEDMILWDGSQGKGTEMVVRGDIVFEGAYLGCSISVNGVCLTATELDFENKLFKAGLAPETLRKTNLGSYESAMLSCPSKSKVNLERASEIGGRNSGHFVQGHIDNVGTIIDRWIDDNSLFFKISFPYEYMRYIVPKGFIAIDGTSLTVCDVCSDDTEGVNWFTFMLVEYTQKKIILPYKDVGDTVNVEVDVLGKYSEGAWEMFAPKMEILEKKVAELERRFKELNGIDESLKEGSVLARDVGKIQYGQVIPQGFKKACHGGPGSKLMKLSDAPRSKRLRPTDDPSLEWTRIQGG